jgi:hypothetical protein
VHFRQQKLQLKNLYSTPIFFSDFFTMVFARTFVALAPVASAATIPASTSSVKGSVPSFVGQVIGTAMQKTIKVRVAKSKIHPVVQKVRHHLSKSLIRSLESASLLFL